MKKLNTMKSLYKSAFVFVLALSLSACEGLLDIDAEGTVSGNIYTDTESIQKALLGAYYSLGGISDGSDGGELLGGDFTLIPTLLAYQNGIEVFWSTVNAPAYGDFINKEILATNLRVESNWRRSYEVINAVNTILANIENVESAEERNRIQGEALAIRGLLYFEMVRLWAAQYDVGDNNAGAVPILTEPINTVDEIEDAVLSSTEEVYVQAENDLLEAASLLEPFGANGTNMSYYACQAYLARLSLQKYEYADAADYAEEVINSGVYQLVGNPRDAFNNPNNSTEDIFAIQQTLANSSGDRTTGTGVTTFYSSLTESGLGVFVVVAASFDSDFLHNSPHYAPNDPRGTIDLDVDANTTSGELTTSFYKNILNNNNGLLSNAKYTRADNVLPVLRLAEMHLVRAEALNELIGPNSISVADLNAIRTRAGIGAVDLADFVDQDQFFDSLEIERNRELIHEGQLLHDLKRWGGFIGTEFNPDDPWDEKFILPIPQTEQDVSELGNG